MELIQEKSELFRKTINSFNQNKLLKFRKTTFNRVENSFKAFETNFTKAKEVQTELSERSEELLEKIKNLRFENERKREILDNEEEYITDMKDNELQRLEDNIQRFQNNLVKEMQEYNQEKLGVDGVYNKLQTKVEALESFVQCYGENLGLTFEKSKDGNFLVIFEEISRVAPQEKHIIEMKYEDEMDRFLVIKTYPEVHSINKLADELSEHRSFLRFLVKARKEFCKLTG